MEETVGMKTLLAVDAQILDDIKKELNEINLMIDGESPDALRPSSPPKSVEEKRSIVRKKWKAAVRQLVFMEKTKDKVQQAYENESVLRLNAMTSISLLCALPIFQGLDNTTLMELNSHVQLKTYAPNSTLFAQDTEPLVFIIRSGTAWIKSSKKGNEKEIHNDDILCESGDVIDPVDILADNPEFRCVAVGFVDAFTIPRKVLLPHREKLPYLSDMLHRTRYPDKASESFRKWAAQTASCLRYEAKVNVTSGGLAPQSFIREILLSISPELDLDHCIQCMARLFQRVFQAQVIRLYLVNAKGTHYVTKFSSDNCEGVQSPISSGIPGIVYTKQQPLRLSVVSVNEAAMQQVDWTIYRRHKSLMAVPIFQPKSVDSITAVWEVISDTTNYSDHELHLLELASTFMQPFLTQCDRPTKRMGSVMQAIPPMMFGPKSISQRLYLATKASTVYATAGLYHGDELLMSPVTLPTLHGTRKSSTVKEFLFDSTTSVSFGCNVQCLPRAAHLAWDIYSTKHQLLARSRCFLFSYDHCLRMGHISLALYRNKADMDLPIQYEGSFLPPTHEVDSYLSLEFPKYQYPLTYRSNDITSTPSMQLIHTETAPPSVNLNVLERDPMRSLSQEEKSYMWSARDILSANPAALMPFLLSVDWANRAHVTEAYKYLYLWSSPTYLQALQLLNRKFPDPFVRAYAVRCLDSLPDYRLRLYLLQLVQALKYEPQHDSALMRFLFVRALKSPSEVGYTLFWLLQSELFLPCVQARFQLLSTQYLCHCGTYRLELYQSIYIMRLLETIAKQVKTQTTKQSCEDELRKQLDRAIVPESFQLPLHPNVFYSSFLSGECRVMDSAKKPLLLYLTPKKQQSCMLQSTIFKCGDDLRQDQLTLQLLRVMDDLWKTESLDLKVSAYACVSTGNNIGFIQVVHQASTLASICWERHRRKKRFRKLAAVKTAMWGKQVFAKWLQDKAGDRRDELVTNFILSSAGYCVATYVLGIGDRHNDNLMLTENGHFLHIDFGHFLGHYKTYMGYKREHAPFVLTPAMVHVMGSRFHEFQKCCVEGFKILRSNASLLITLLELALSCGIPELTKDTIPWLANTLLLELTDEEAEKRFEQLIKDALSTVTTRINHATHILAH